MMGKRESEGVSAARVGGRRRRLLVFGWLPALAVLFLVQITTAGLSPRPGSQACLEHTLPYVQNVTPDSIVVMWHTCFPAQGQVRYRAQGQASWIELADGEPATVHEVVIQSLVPAKTYEYQVSRDGSEAWAPSTPAAFQPAPGDAASCRVVVYGDTRTEADMHAAVVQAIFDADPRIVLHVGDLVEAGRDLDQWEPQFFSPAAGLMLNTPLYPVAGNHEYGGTGPVIYHDFFALPGNEQWYAFTFGCARFVGLNNVADFDPGSEQHSWLLEELQSPEFGQAAWQIVFFHYPPYTSGPHLGSERPTELHLVPLFEQYGVDLVLAGHNHHYERSLKDGITYIVTGGGGANLVGFPNVEANPYSQVRVQAHHYTTLDLDCTSGTLEFNAWDTRSARIDGPVHLKHPRVGAYLPLILHESLSPGQNREP